ncbi:hypothetical protein ADL19_25200 [Streptomyces purpurogeneiscleroticus]|nr:hypothetical protein ADL19_25200 [Streptomyces purpurogeneiscleroticus]
MGKGVDTGGQARPQEAPVTITISNLQPLIAILAGILILVMPRLLNYIVAIYLIIVGVIGLGILH